MTAPALQVHDLGKVFRVPHARANSDPRRRSHSRRRDDFWALDALNFSVPAGQTLGIVGANGSGKSTLLKILACVMTPDHGGFTARGRIGALLELGAGFHPDLSGVENVYLNGALLGFSTREIDRLMPEIIEFAELERFMDMPVRHFSSGMHARLGFAVATRLAPEILLMDETFATGDARFQAKALAHIGRIKAEGHTLLLVSHSLELLTDLADQILWLDHGLLRALGTPRDILPEYRRSQQSLGMTADYRRGLGGFDALFQPLADPPGPVTFSHVELTGGLASTSPPALTIATPAEFTLHITLRHPAAAGPSEILLAAAWLRERDARILAQSQLPLVLPCGATESQFQLTFGDLPLNTDTWRLACALRTPGAPTFSALHEFPYLIHTTTPHPELPTLTPLPAHWSIR